MPNETILLSGLSNREFLEQYSRPGCIGLSGGVTLIDRAICRAERHLDPNAKWSQWSHAFFLQGKRADGHHWLVESDLQVQHKHIRLGVQENRISKYFDEELYTTLAILDFGLAETQVGSLIQFALDLVANRANYSMRELIGTLIALRHPGLRSRNNLLAREHALFCSAFVQHLYRNAGLDLAPGVDIKNTTPEHIARTTIPHVTYLLQHKVATSKVKEFQERVRKRLARK